MAAVLLTDNSLSEEIRDFLPPKTTFPWLIASPRSNRDDSNSSLINGTTSDAT